MRAAMQRAFVQWFSSTDGRDRVLIGWRNTTRWAFSLPKWLSYQSWRYRRGEKHVQH